MFYSYAYPSPDGFVDQPVKPPQAYFDETLGEFVLPYVDVIESLDPQATLMAFLQSTYEAAANSANWDRAASECDIGHIGKPQPLARGQ